MEISEYTPNNVAGIWIEAVQVSHANIGEVANWIGGEVWAMDGDVDNPVIYLEDAINQTVAHIGEWVAKSLPEENLFILTDYEIRHRYEKRRMYNI